MSSVGREASENREEIDHCVCSHTHSRLQGILATIALDLTTFQQESSKAGFLAVSNLLTTAR